MQSSNYVVCAKIKDVMTYDLYLQNLSYVQAGFNQIYKERSQAMFGKNFLALDKEILEEKAQYDTIRSRIPKAISVVEREREKDHNQ